MYHGTYTEYISGRSLQMKSAIPSNDPRLSGFRAHQVIISPGRTSGRQNLRGLHSWPQFSDEELLEIERLSLHVPDSPWLMKVNGHPFELVWSPSLPIELLYLLLVSDYEQSDCDLIKRYVRRGDRAVEVGGGIGLTGMYLAMVSCNQVRLVEPNYRLWPWIESNFSRNNLGLDLVRSACGVELEVLLTLSHNYWWSSSRLPKDQGDESIAAPCISLESACSGMNVLSVDIEGSEVEVLSQTIPSGIRTLFCEIHTPDIGGGATGELLSGLVRQGFSIVDQSSWTWVFKR